MCAREPPPLNGRASGGVRVRPQKIISVYILGSYIGSLLDSCCSSFLLFGFVDDPTSLSHPGTYLEHASGPRSVVGQFYTHAVWVYWQNSAHSGDTGKQHSGTFKKSRVASRLSRSWPSCALMFGKGIRSPRLSV